MICNIQCPYCEALIPSDFDILMGDSVTCPTCFRTSLATVQTVLVPLPEDKNDNDPFGLNNYGDLNV